MPSEQAPKTTSPAGFPYGLSLKQPLYEEIAPPSEERRNYFKELLIEPNLSLTVVPRLFTTVMIAKAIPAAMRPYSIAVAPDSSDQNF